MKRKLMLGLALLLGLILSSCSTSSNNLSIFLYDETDTFISAFSENLVEALDESYRVKVFDAKKSQSIQNRQIINELENKRPKALIINMVDRLSSSSIVQKASMFNIPVIFFNREPVHSDIRNTENTYYVGTNPIQEGTNQGIMAIDLLGSPNALNKSIDKNNDNKLQCLFIQGEANHQSTEIRTYSCIDYLNKMGYELDILGMESADWNREKSKNIMKVIYPKYGDKIEFVFSNNDDMALGVIDYLKENHLLYQTTDNKTPFPIVGVDGTIAGLQAIDDNLLYGTSINDSEEQVRVIIELLKLLDGTISKDQFERDVYPISDSHYVYVTSSLVSQKNSLK